METTLDFSPFEQSYQMDLVFSAIDGLKPGQKIKIVCDQDSNELKDQLQHAQPQGVEWEVVQVSSGSSEVHLKKSIKEQGGCCGICGHDKE